MSVPAAPQDDVSREQAQAAVRTLLRDLQTKIPEVDWPRVGQFEAPLAEDLHQALEVLGSRNAL